MVILGITHPISLNGAACLLVDGRLLAFAEEERFIRLKHAPHMYPEQAVDFCLRHAGLMPSHVDVMAIGFTAQSKAPPESDIQAYLAGVLHPSKQFDVRASLALIHCDGLIQGPGRRMYLDHHLCHVASAVIPSGFDRTNFISLDGWGGAGSGLVGEWVDGTLRVHKEISLDRSWGMLYELVTYYLGFRPHSGEGKTMGLSAYGRVDEEVLPDWCEPEMGLPDVGRYRNYFAERHQVRTGGSPLTQAHRDLAATVQSYYERSLVKIARMLFQSNGCRRFALAGGVALNCSGNGVLASEDFIESLFVQPASHDGGTALGAAILAHHELSGEWPLIDFAHAYWGPDYTQDEIRQTLDSAKLCYREVDPVQAIGAALSEDRVIGLFQGRAEIGPRALGNRSILANPQSSATLHRVNTLKRREAWRPLAPSVLEEFYSDLFNSTIKSPFMLIAAPVRPSWKGRIPAVTHIDGSARPQGVSAKSNALFHAAISEFHRTTGVPAVLNTSFNMNDEPLVNAPEHALATFFRSGLDTLIIGNFAVDKPRS